VREGSRIASARRAALTFAQPILMTYTEAFRHLRSALSAMYDTGEAAAIARKYLHARTGFEYSAGLATGNLLQSLSRADFSEDVAALASGKPVQYVVGWEEFLRRRFSVNDAVLIPRPETEALVQWVVDECADATAVLDVGTGSGCIAVSVALALPGAHLWAVDVSEAALVVARRNAEDLGARVSFVQMDALDSAAWQALPPMDVIVSNPPYIPASDAPLLHANVRDWEPHGALFVADTDPLVFYRALAAAGCTHLVAGGRIYCELQRDLSEETAAVFRAAGYQIVLRADDAGWRMVRAMKA